MLNPEDIRRMMISTLEDKKPLKPDDIPYSERSEEELRMALYDLVIEVPNPGYEAMKEFKETVIQRIRDGDTKSLKANSDEKVSIGGGHEMCFRYWPDLRVWEWEGMLIIDGNKEFYADAYQEGDDDDTKGKRPVREEEADDDTKGKRPVQEEESGDRAKRSRSEKESKGTSQS